jgi:hypothetical protein
LSGTNPRPIVCPGHCSANNRATAGPVVSTCLPAAHRSETVTTPIPAIPPFPPAILTESTFPKHPSTRRPQATQGKQNCRLARRHRNQMTIP